MPFWRYGFLPPPRTSPRVLVSCVPDAAAGELRGHDLVEHGLVDRRREELVVQLDAAEVLAGAVEQGRRRHHWAFFTRIRPPRPPGRLPLTSSRFCSASARTTRTFLVVTVLVAHVAGHAQALVDATGRGARADRARLAVVVRAVGLGAAMEVVALDVAGEALALRDAAHVDEVALGEHVADGEGLADLVLADVVDAELAQRAEARQVAELARARAC